MTKLPVSDDQAVPQREGDPGRPTRVGLWALALGCLGFLSWALFAPLDEGVPSHGMVTLDTKRKPVQHQTGGIVREVLVREGDIVTEGQLLVRLDDAVARANFETVRQRYLTLRGTESRLVAEKSGASAIVFHPDLQKVAGDPVFAQQMRNQAQLLASRQASLQADVQGLQEAIAGQEGMVQAYQGMLASRQGQVALLKEELTNTRELVKDGYVPRNRQLELERMVAETVTAQTELQGNTVRSRQSMAELRQKAIARQQDYRKELESQLADVTREVQSDLERLKAAGDELARTELRAPSQGQVVGIAFQTVGSVVPAGQKLMDIVPEREALMLEARVVPQLVDRVSAGLPVDIRFTNFAHSPQLVVAGKVLSVSKDVITDPQNNSSFYLARVGVTAEGLKTLGQRQMQPGMPVELVFKTGERSLLTYLLHPLSKRMAAAMKEE